jgi:hypothetical protein
LKLKNTSIFNRCAEFTVEKTINLIAAPLGFIEENGLKRYVKKEKGKCKK